MRPKKEIETDLEYFEQKLPSIRRTENDATILSIETIVNTLQWALNHAEIL